ncbi:AAA family ATPase [Mycolicibacterium sp. CBM1]
MTEYRSGLIPLNWAALGKVPAARPVIPSLLNEGESGSLIGQGAVGKSLLALDIAVSLASGKSVLGHPAGEPITVMYIDMENSAPELAERLRSMGREPESLTDIPLRYFSFPELPMSTATES